MSAGSPRDNSATMNTRIPKASEVKSGNNNSSYTISNAAIRDGDNILPEILGIVRSYGIATGEKKEKGTPFQILECDIERAKPGGTDDETDIVTVGVFLTGSQDGEFKPSAHALRFIEGLVDMVDDELVHLSVADGGPIPGSVNRKSYVNWSHVRENEDGEFTKSWFVQRPKQDPRPSLESATQRELDKLKGRALYKDRTREKKGDGGPGSSLTHIGLLCALCESKGWPTPDQAKEPWLAVVNAKFRTDYTAMVKVSEDQWGELRQLIESKQALPKAVNEWIAKTGWTAPSADEDLEF